MAEKRLDRPAGGKVAKGEVEADRRPLDSVEGLSVRTEGGGRIALAVKDHPVDFEFRIEGEGFRKLRQPGAALPAAPAGSAAVERT